MAKLLLFDIDGTLISTGGAGSRALDRAFIDVLTLKDAATRTRLDGKTDRAILREIIRTHADEIRLSATIRAATEERLIAQVLDRYLFHLPEEVHQSSGYTILPGITNILQKLKGNPDFVLGLATGNVHSGAQIKLARGNLYHYFRLGGYGCDSEVRSEIVATAIERAQNISKCKFLPRDIFVIGDTHHDILAGQAHGAKTIAVATGYYSGEILANYAPNHVFADLADEKHFFNALAA